MFHIKDLHSRLNMAYFSLPYLAQLIFLSYHTILSSVSIPVINDNNSLS